MGAAVDAATADDAEDAGVAADDIGERNASHEGRSFSHSAAAHCRLIALELAAAAARPLPWFAPPQMQRQRATGSPS